METTATPTLIAPPAPPPVELPSVAPVPEPPSPRRRRGVVLAVVVVLAVGGVVAFAAARGWLQLPGRRPKLSDAEILARALDALPTITSGSMRVALTLKTEPRDEGAQPIPLPSAAGSPIPGQPGVSDSGADFMFQNAPSDVDASITVHSDFNAPSDVVGDFSNGVGVKITAGGLAFAGDGELRKIGETLYGRVNEFPSLGVFDLHAVKGQWVAMSQDDLAGSGFDISAKLRTSVVENEHIVEQYRLLLKLMRELQVISIAKVLPPTAVDGLRYRRYVLAIDRTKLPLLYRQFIEQAKFGADAAFRFDQVVAAVVENPELAATIDALFQNTTIEVWVQDQTFLPRQLSVSLRFVPPESVVKLAGKQYRLTFAMTLERVNQPVAITAPSPTISFDQAVTLVTGKPIAVVRADRQLRNVEAIRLALARYRRHAGIYPEALSELRQSPDEVPVGSGLSGESGSEPFLASLPTDLFTVQPYPYQREGDDYTLRYQIRLDGASPSPSVEYQDGDNTADQSSVSREATNVRDSDGDGLTDDEEHTRYGSNAYDQDTDGDGFADGVEVQNGYDPTGPGRLPGSLP